jgi:hypothetical protein
MDEHLEWVIGARHPFCLSFCGVGLEILRSLKMQLIPSDLHDAVRHTGGVATSGIKPYK